MPDHIPSFSPELIVRHHRGHASLTPDAKWGKYVVQSQRSDSIRDIRSTLLEAAYTLRKPGNSELQTVCLLMDSKVSDKRLADELKWFKAVVHPDLAARIHLANVRRGEELQLPELDREFVQWARVQALHQSYKESVRGVSQRTVFAHLVRSWLMAEPPQTVKAIQEATLLSYPTVAKVLEVLDGQGVLHRTSDRRVGLSMFPWSEWRRWAVAGANKQAALSYMDPTGLPVSTDRMVKRLDADAYPHLAVSGILGAKHYFPQLNIRGNTRLDLVATGSIESFNANVVRQLDPALMLIDHKSTAPALVVHFPEQRRDNLFRRVGATNWADPIDCISDLYDLRMDAQADEMVHFLIDARERALGGAKRGAMGGKGPRTDDWT